MIKPLSLASFNWKVLLKSLFCQVLVLAIVMAFGVTVFGDLARDVMRVLGESNLREFANSTIASIMNGTFNSADFTAQLNAVISNVQENIKSIHYPFAWGGATLSYIVVILTLLVYRLFVSYTDVTVECQLEEFMTSNASRPFIWFLLKKQGRTWAFSALQLLCTVPLDLLILTGCLGLYLTFLIAFGWWTIIPVLIIALVLYAARQTVFAFCLPAVVCEDMSARQAFKYGASRIVFRFWSVFWKTLIVIGSMTAISAAALVCISNPVWCTVVITIPNLLLFFCLKCVNIVEYFNAHNRPYFYKRVVIEGTDRYNKRLARKQRKSPKPQSQDIGQNR